MDPLTEGPGEVVETPETEETEEAVEAMAVMPEDAPAFPLPEGLRPTTVNRELSWLAFNGRVLQEAADPTVPLYERLAFLSIVSSNLDEFFRVRVAALRSLLRLRKRRRRALSISPTRLLEAIHDRVEAQQRRFGAIFDREILPALREHRVEVHPSVAACPEAHESLDRYFREEVQPLIRTHRLGTHDAFESEAPFLEDQGIHLVVRLRTGTAAGFMQGTESEWSLVSIPSPPLPRFATVDAGGGRRLVFFLDDVVRWRLAEIFPDDEVGEAYAVKLTRDAELFVEDEFEGDVVKAVLKSLSKRDTGLPSRFLYDGQAPATLIGFLVDCLGLEEEDLVEGGRYHNLHDLRSFPRPVGGDQGLVHPPWTPIPHPTLEGADSILGVLRDEGDQLLHIPYHSFNYVTRWLREAARDPSVEEIYLTVYRVASDSEVMESLLEAARRGKKVRVFFEVLARFDEEANVRWGARLAEAGAVALYGTLDRKVHAKVALVRRREGPELRNYAYLGTGNFNESTARFYTDLGLFTADPRLADEIYLVFQHLQGEAPEPAFEHLWVAPFQLRERVYATLAELREARAAGRDAELRLKLNALQDPEVVRHVHATAAAGVPVRGVIRGICCLAPGDTPGLDLRSVVDRYLEHGRIYHFRVDDEDRVFLASADWMRRNLSRRVEVAFPIYDPEIRRQILDTLDIHLGDRPKARLIDRQGRNLYAKAEPGSVAAQEAHRAYVLDLAKRG